MSYTDTLEESDFIDAVMDAEKAEDEKTIKPNHIPLFDFVTGRFMMCMICQTRRNIPYDINHIQSERMFINEHLHGKQLSEFIGQGKILTGQNV
jgi:hypothetical protein